MWFFPVISWGSQCLLKWTYCRSLLLACPILCFNLHGPSQIWSLQHCQAHGCLGLSLTKGLHNTSGAGGEGAENAPAHYISLLFGRGLMKKTHVYVNCVILTIIILAVVFLTAFGQTLTKTVFWLCLSAGSDVPLPADLDLWFLFLIILWGCRSHLAAFGTV